MSYFKRRLLTSLRQSYTRHMFCPTPISIIINPFFLIRRNLYKCLQVHQSALSGKLLDFGCGKKPYQHLFSCDLYIGVDMLSTGHNHVATQADVYYDGHHLPFPDHTFDSILCSEVLEHVFNIDQILSELYRVLRPGGRILITVPFAWDEHEEPFDFARYTSFGMRHICVRAGFEIGEICKTGSYVEAVVQLASAYIYQHVLPKRRGLALAMTPFFVAPINLFGVVASHLLPKKMNFFQNLVILAEKPLGSVE